MTIWKDVPPFHGVFVDGVGEDQTVLHLPERETFLEVLEDLRVARKSNPALDFIRNGDGFSILPSKVTPPPEPRKPK